MPTAKIKEPGFTGPDIKNFLTMVVLRHKWKLLKKKPGEPLIV